MSLATPETLWVNVTTGEVALGVQLHWRPDVPLTLSLGYGYRPNGTSYDARTQLLPATAPGSPAPRAISLRWGTFKLEDQSKEKPPAM
jgi:hypothetical protein